VAGAARHPDAVVALFEHPFEDGLGESRFTST
jgi:hypothetical protein